MKGLKTLNCLQVMKKMEKETPIDKQQQMDGQMQEITAKFPALFEGVGRAKVDLIHL